MDDLKQDTANTIARIAKEIECINNAIIEHEERIVKHQAAKDEEHLAKQKLLDQLIGKIEDLK